MGASDIEALATRAEARAQLVLNIAERMCRSHHWRVRRHPSHVAKPVTEPLLRGHANGGMRIGLCPIAPGTDTARAALLDMDSHKGEVPWPSMAEKARAIVEHMRSRGLAPIPFRSSGGNGVHIYTLWNEPQDAYSVRELQREILDACGLKHGTKGVAAGDVEAFPKQDMVPEDGAGSMWVLPLADRSELLDPETFEPVEVPPDFELPMSEPVAKRERRAPAVPAEVSPDLAELRAALAKIPNDEAASLDYDAWRNIIFGIHDATGGSAEGLALAHEFSSKNPKYDSAFLDERVWPHIRSEGREKKKITAATIFDLARRHENPLDDLEALSEEEPAGEANAVRKRFEVLDDQEARHKRAPLTWIIKGVLPRAGLIVMYGESGSGKSFASLDIAAAIARGEAWRGLRTKQLSVVYVAAEGAGGFMWRLEAYCKANGIDRIGLGVVTDAPNMLVKAHVSALVEQLKAYGQLDLIILDTLAAISPGGNENSAEDMGAVLGECKRLASATGATVMLVHHSGKDLTKGARGWSGLKAAVDAEFEVLREGDVRQLRISKLKDGEDGATFQFKLRAVEVGTDEDGDAITSCVVEHLAAGGPVLTATKKGHGRVGGLGAVQAIVLKCAHELCELGDETVPTGAVIDAASLQIAQDPAKREYRRSNVERAITSLAAAGYLRVEDDKVRTTSKGEWRAKAEKGGS